ncbi:hypothetical protein [Caminibacter sp.]
MKKISNIKFDGIFKKLSEKVSFFKKYDYNIDEVIGVKGNERYILYTKQKLIRIYRGKLKSNPLLTSYIPIENAIFYSFKVEKSVIEKIDLDSFVETKVYDEAGVDETEEYIIKYKVIDKLKENKFVEIETVIVPVTFLYNHFKNIVDETGYIDYISFPAFSYRALYQEKILRKANDVFAVILYDKIFLTFYSEGELVYIQTLSGGIEKIYQALSSLKIKNFDLELLKKILSKKGLAETKYNSNELMVLEIVKKELKTILNLINEQIRNFISNYEIDSIDRIYITSEYGDVPDLDLYVSRELKIECYNFEFYEKYNLDRLPVDPFLFLSMMEAHYAYKNQDQSYNFSIFLRKPTFLYRPSGKLTLSIILVIIICGAYPFYLWIKGLNYQNKNSLLSNQISSLQSQVQQLSMMINRLTEKNKSLIIKIDNNTKEITEFQKFIESVYNFKYSYMPKSQELVDITYYMNKNKVYAKNISYKNGIYKIILFSYGEENIPNLIKDLSNNGYNVDFNNIVYKNGKYNSIIRIEE